MCDTAFIILRLRDSARVLTLPVKPDDLGGLLQIGLELLGRARLLHATALVDQLKLWVLRDLCLRMHKAIRHAVAGLGLESLLGDLVLEAATIEGKGVLVEEVSLPELHAVTGGRR